MADGVAEGIFDFHARAELAAYLLDVARSAPAPATSGAVLLWVAGKNGWKVVYFYDAGELDYIDRFVAPNGKVIDFWDWPDSFARNALCEFRG